MKFKQFDFLDFESKNKFTRKTWLVLLMLPAVYFVYNTLISLSAIIFTVFYAMVNSGSPKAFLNPDAVRLFALFSAVMAVVTVLAYVKYAEMRPFSTMGVTKNKILRQFGLGSLLGLAMIGVPILILFLFNGTISLNKNTCFNLLILYLLGFIVQGISEEFFMRGYIFTSLYKASNLIFAVTVSSLIFALLHLINPETGLLPFMNYFLFGVFACLFFLRTKNIWAVSVFNGVWSIFQGNIFGIQISGHIYHETLFNIESAAPSWLSGDDFGLEGGLIVTAVLITAALLTIFVGKNKLIENSLTKETLAE